MAATAGAGSPGGRVAAQSAHMTRKCAISGIPSIVAIIAVESVDRKLTASLLSQAALSNVAPKRLANNRPNVAALGAAAANTTISSGWPPRTLTPRVETTAAAT